jgi:carbon-monoxide dehydrogenase large subunit
MGSGGAGHGHETAFRQLLADRLGLPMERIGFVQSDTARIPDGIGTAASWSMTLGGSSVHLVAEAAVAAARVVVAGVLGVQAEAVHFADGLFRAAGSNQALGWDEIIAASPGFAVSAAFTGHGETLPIGCHACEVEVDPETGAVTLAGYAVAQDSGVLVNPMLVEGQLHGGVAQGVGQAWMEAMRYDAEGQLVSGSLMDYALPRAADLPVIATLLSETPADDNPLGVKGVGESAACGSPPAFVNAVLDALAPLGVTGIATPTTPERIWQAIAVARRG